MQGFKFIVGSWHEKNTSAFAVMPLVPPLFLLFPWKKNMISFLCFKFLGNSGMEWPNLAYKHKAFRNIQMSELQKGT